MTTSENSSSGTNRHPQVILANSALLPQGWAENVLIRINQRGEIESVTAAAADSLQDNVLRVATLLPAPANLHSHAFQRAMAGMSERRGPEQRDTFWTWRQIMYRFLDILTPEDIEAITAFVQMEMLEAGYACNVEFHYVHHQPSGQPYANLAELSERVIAASQTTGIGLTLLPVLYQQGGCDGRPLGPGQIRFGNDFDRYARLREQAAKSISTLPEDCRTVGVAPHSLRAVTRESLAQSIDLAQDVPLHMHIAEQVAEVDEVLEAYGSRPVDWLLNSHEVTSRWCLIHCTQMTATETTNLARTGAVAGLCPITESSLGDGIFDGVSYLRQGGSLGIGSDSNIRISLSEELRTLEYSQRLRDKCRASVATPEFSTGRVLFDAAVKGGAQAAGRPSGSIQPGQLADLIGLDGQAIELEGRQDDELLDAWIFAGDDRLVRDAWSAGRHLVKEGRHIAHDEIGQKYRRTLQALRQRL